MLLYIKKRERKLRTKEPNNIEPLNGEGYKISAAVDSQLKS
jgi:hypothetical protein